MKIAQANKILRRIDDYTPQEILAAVFNYCSEGGGWPNNELSQILCHLKADKAKLKFAADTVLAKLPEDAEGFRQGYLTTEGNDCERMMASPIIPRGFIEALSDMR